MFASEWELFLEDDERNCRAYTGTTLTNFILCLELRNEKYFFVKEKVQQYREPNIIYFSHSILVAAGFTISRSKKQHSSPVIIEAIIQDQEIYNALELPEHMPLQIERIYLPNKNIDWQNYNAARMSISFDFKKIFSSCTVEEFMFDK